MPLRSEPALAAVGDVLGTLSVDVSLMKMYDSGIWRARAQTWCREWSG